MIKKVLVVLGTRPEAIKLCPLILELRNNPTMFVPIVCCTGQHRTMVDQVFRLFDISPDYDLNLMKTNQTLTDVTCGVLRGVGSIIKEISPHLVLVQGDTATSFAAALAAFYHEIPVGHVEAGLRTKNKYSPFPEEMNRRMTSVLADVHFAATHENRSVLIREGVPEKKVFVTGNTVIDALFGVRARIARHRKDYGELQTIDFNKKIILVTGHRRENFGAGFRRVCEALQTVAQKFPEIEIVYPVHLNPNVQAPVYELLGELSNVKLISPLSYEPFVFLMEHAFFIISDSGGIQEEAPALGKPVLVTRDSTERQEAVDAGTVKLVGTDRALIVLESVRLLTDEDYYNEFSKVQNPYGDGQACRKIIEGMSDYFCPGSKNC